MMTLLRICKPKSDHERELAHLIGDALHKAEVYTALGDFGEAVDKQFLSNAAQARWIKKYRPDLIKRDPSGNLPSEHSLGTILEIEYATSRAFQSTYKRWLYCQNVGRDSTSSTSEPRAGDKDNRAHVCGDDRSLADSHQSISNAKGASVGVAIREG